MTSETAGDPEIDTASTAPAAPAWHGWVRLATGLVQGLVLYWLHEAHEGKVWPDTQPVLLGALSLAFGLGPLVLLGGLGDLRRRTLIVWFAAAFILLLGLGAYDVWSQAPGATPSYGFLYLSWQMAPVAAAWLFIAHHLIVAADSTGQRIAPYPAYFDAAWKNGVQLALSAAFLGAFWAVLGTGAALFYVIGIEEVGRTISKPWFAIPASAIVFAGAVHLTDVRAGLTLGIRTVALALLSWLMPLLALLAAAFLLALPFTGLDPLWQTRSAAAVLLGAAAVLIVLINAAYQDGDERRRPNRLLRIAGRVAALVLTPLVFIAGYALALRVQQYGWTPERILAAAAVLVGACYAAGYAVAALRPGPWLKRLEITNIVTALAILAVLLLLFSPVADPARISVADQLARLRDGRVTPDKLDYLFLRYDAGRYGDEALRRLAAGKGPAASRAADALRLKGKSRWEVPAKAPPAPSELPVLPKGARLPQSFITQQWPGGEFGACAEYQAKDCYAHVADLDGDGVLEVIAGSEMMLHVFKQGPDGRWSDVGRLDGADCQVRRDLEAGGSTAAPSRWRDLRVGDRVLRFVPNYTQGLPRRRC